MQDQPLCEISAIYPPEVVEKTVFVAKVTGSAAVVLVAPDTLPHRTKQTWRCLTGRARQLVDNS